eukprot:snap_masked-scaffold_7-processed-gene-18.31-mRNA-1 protein AED:1.00 eAED:1.00 QI:0/-1/0/0/-1/1/1/0/484
MVLPPPEKEKPSVPMRLEPRKLHHSSAVVAIRTSLYKQRSRKKLVNGETTGKLPVEKKGKFEIQGENEHVFQEGGLEKAFQEWQLKAVPRVLSSEDTIERLHELVNIPVPAGDLVRCQIEIINHIDSARPFYVLTLPSQPEVTDLANEKRVAVITAKKSGISLRYQYLLTLEPEDYLTEDTKRSKWFFGKIKVKKKTIGTSKVLQYILYDRGISKKKSQKYKEALKRPLQKNTRTPKSKFLPKNFWKNKDSDGEDASKGYSESGTYSSSYYSYSYSDESKETTSNYDTDSSFEKKMVEKKTEEKNRWVRAGRQPLLSVIFPVTSVKSNFQLKVSAMFLKNSFHKPLETSTKKRERRKLAAAHLEYYGDVFSELKERKKVGKKVIRSLKDEYVSLFNRFNSEKLKRPSISDLVRYPVAPSIKNYEIALLSDSEEYPCSGLARIGAKRFFLVVKKPLSLYQAFAIAICRIDSRNSFGQKFKRNVWV